MEQDKEQPKKEHVKPEKSNAREPQGEIRRKNPVKEEVKPVEPVAAPQPKRINPGGLRK